MTDPKHTPGKLSHRIENGNVAVYSNVSVRPDQGCLASPLVADFLEMGQTQTGCSIGHAEAIANAKLFIQAPALLSRAEKAEKQRDELLEASEAVLALVDAGLLMRDISGDSKPGWTLQAAKIVQKLQALQVAIAGCEGGSR